MDVRLLLLFVSILVRVGGIRRCSVVTRRYIKDEVCMSGAQPSPTTIPVTEPESTTSAPKIDGAQTTQTKDKKECTSTPFHMTGVLTADTFCVDTPGWCVGDVMTFDATFPRESAQFLLDNGRTDLIFIMDIKIADNQIVHGFYMDGVRRMPYTSTIMPFPIKSGDTYTFLVEAKFDHFKVFLKEEFLISHPYPGKYKNTTNISNISRVCFTDMHISKMSKIQKN